MSYDSYLPVGGTLKGGEHKVSPNGAFTMILQQDGNLVIHRGNDPKSVLWASQSDRGGGNPVELTLQEDGNLVIYTLSGGERTPTWASQTKGTVVSFLKVCDDGNLVIYQQTEDKTRTQGVWWSNATDPVAKITFTSISYDLDKATMEDPTIVDSGEVPVSNSDGIEQTPKATGSLSYGQTSTWEDTISTDITVTAEAEVEIPFVADAKVTTSVSVTNAYTRGRGETVTRTHGWELPVRLEPRTKSVAFATMLTTSIKVPFTQHGTIHYKSGKEVKSALNGLYLGDGNRVIIELAYSKAVPIDAPDDALREMIPVGTVNVT